MAHFINRNIYMNTSETKICSACRTAKAKGEFSACKRRNDGLQSRCKSCAKISNKEYYRTVDLSERYNRYKESYIASRRKYQGTLTGRINGLLSSARLRANKSRLEYSLTAEWLLGKFESQDMRCELTMIPFIIEPARDDGRRSYQPFSPSLDRIDPKKGYTADNTRLVCTAINIALNQFGDDVFAEIATAFLKNRPPRQPAGT